jgi:hypothetical protein
MAVDPNIIQGDVFIPARRLPSDVSGMVFPFNVLIFAVPNKLMLSV